VKRTAIGCGVYQDPSGGYWARPIISHRRTWRKLKAKSNRKAMVEANTGEFAAKSRRFSSLAQLWMDSGCPGKRGKCPVGTHLTEARARAISLNGFFGKFGIDEIQMIHLPAYADWRRRRMVRKANTGGRTVDIDLVTLSNIMRFAVMRGELKFNYVRSDRPRYQENIRHARSVMPESAEIIHQIAGELLQSVKSEVMGWLCFFSEFTGCRTSELLRLRTDAKNKLEAGFIEWLTPAELNERADDVLGHLYLGRRSKNGLNPWSKINAEFADMIRAFQAWHKLRFVRKDAPWFFPGTGAADVIVPGSFGHALKRVTKGFNLEHITPHGFRAFYATKRLRDGARPVDIAAEMGDKTVALIETIYADNAGGKKLWWTPADGVPAWTEWTTRNEVDSFGTTAGKPKKPTSPNPDEMVPRGGFEPTTN